MGERKYRQFSREFKVAALERMQAGESPSALQRELGVKRRSLYERKKRVEDGGPENLRDAVGPARSRTAWSLIAASQISGASPSWNGWWASSRR